MNKLDVKNVTEIQTQILSAWNLANIFAELAKNVVATQNAVRTTTHAFEQLRDILDAPGFCRCSTQTLIRNGCQCNGI